MRSEGMVRKIIFYTGSLPNQQAEPRCSGLDGHLRRALAGSLPGVCVPTTSTQEHQHDHQKSSIQLCVNVVKIYIPRNT